MKNSFTLGAIAGITSIALAVPVLAQVSSAATTTTTGATSSATFARPIPTQQNILDRAARDATFLKNIDAMVTVQKSTIQAHQTALTAAATITDDTQRQAAVQKADQDQRAAIEAAITANPDLKSAMMPLRGGAFGGRGGHGHGGPMFHDKGVSSSLSSSAQ